MSSETEFAIKLTLSSRLRNIGLVLIMLVAVGVTAYFASGYVKTLLEDEPLTVVTTIVCGPFNNPLIVDGVPIRMNSGTGSNFIVFSDGYALRVQELTSLFMNRRAMFTIEDGDLTQYAIITRSDFHPCPPQDSITVEAPNGE